MILFDYVNDRGKNEILEWSSGLQTRDRAKLEQKLRRLTQVTVDLARQTHLLAGPLVGSIYKLRVNATVMLRPHLCTGPVDKRHEYTLLVGAVESGDRLPEGIETTALDREKLVALNPTRHRVAHSMADS